MTKDSAILLDIVKAGRLIKEFLGEANEKGFSRGIRTQSAVIHQLLIIGEATKRLSHEFREQHDEIPWPLMAGMRDVLIHAYESVDLEEVWKTATKDVPDIIAKPEPLLPSQENRQ